MRIDLTQGDTFTYLFVFTDTTADPVVPIDLTGHTATCAFVKNSKPNITQTATATIHTPAAGEVFVEIAETDMPLGIWRGQVAIHIGGVQVASQQFELNITEQMA